MAGQWIIKNKQTGETYKDELHLYWEVSGDPITDDYSTDEIDAVELYRMWRRRYPEDVQEISWYIMGSRTTEGAPYLREDEHDEDFLTFFRLPIHAESGENLNFLRLPVADKLWRPGRGDKGGFIQEALGWKPSPYQLTADFSLLDRIASLR